MLRWLRVAGAAVVLRQLTEQALQLQLLYGGCTVALTISIFLCIRCHDVSIHEATVDYALLFYASSCV